MDMDMDAFYKLIYQAGYIPAIQSDGIRDAGKLAHALVTGNIGVAEVNLTDEAAASLIADMRAAEPTLVVGAGAVATTSMLDAAVAAGAGFIVLPSYDEVLCHACMDKGIPCIPTTVDEGGVFKSDKMGLTVTGIVTADDRDAIGVIDTFARAFKGHRFFPEGRVDETNIEKYLANPAVVACCSQDWVTRPDLVEGGEYEGIGRLAAEANALVRRSR